MLFSDKLYRIMTWKSKSEQRNAILPLEVMWPKWNTANSRSNAAKNHRPISQVISTFFFPFSSLVVGLR